MKDSNNNSYFFKEACYRLIGAIIGKAVEDANLTNDFINESPTKAVKLEKLKNRRKARVFFYSPMFLFYCNLTELSPDYVRTALTQEALQEAKEYNKEQENARKRLQENV